MAADETTLVHQTILWLEKHWPFLATMVGGAVAMLATIYRSIRSLNLKLDAIPIEVIQRKTRLATKHDLERCHERVLGSLGQSIDDLEKRHDKQDQARSDHVFDKMDTHMKLITSRLDKMDEAVTGVHKRLDAHIDGKLK